VQFERQFRDPRGRSALALHRGVVGELRQRVLREDRRVRVPLLARFSVSAAVASRFRMSAAAVRAGSVPGVRAIVTRPRFGVEQPGIACPAWRPADV
jgi:hypothetical protein